MPDWIGKTIGKVQIEKLLARGGMAEVYLGSHLNLQRSVAIKVLHSYIEEDPILIDRFRREARVVAGLRHSNIVQVFDFETTDGHPYIVMEYLRGPTLAAYLRHLHQRKKRLSSEQVAGLLKGLTDALDYAHRQGVIHRDIKPGNIMLHSKSDEVPLDRPLASDVEAILTDFGLVRVVNTASQTASGFLSGTPAYMSPEQARGDQIDQRTDIYSLGVVLYEMLAGRVPFEADNTVTILHMHIHTTPPPIPGIAARVQAVLDRALAKNPNDRYRTSQEMAIDYYRAIGMPSKVDINREPYPLTPVPFEVPPPTQLEPEVTTQPPPEPAPKLPPRREPEPAPKPQPRLEAEPPLRSQPQIISEPRPKSEPRIEQAPRPARSRLWIGVGLFSLVCLPILAFGAYRFLSAGTLFPISTQPVGQAVTNTVSGPAPTEASVLPAADRMVEVTAGTYEVGASVDPVEYHIPPTTVELNSFWMDQYQTTNAEYQQYREATGAPEPTVPGEADHPVIGVTWEQAQAYCTWMKKRLPKEAEWEAAGRGPNANPYPWGTDPTAEGQALNLPDDGTYAVGTLSFNKSHFGVFDMVGNIWEWVGEPYADAQQGYILRGGRYGLPVLDLAYRLAVPVDDTRYLKYAGFRCAADEVQ
jgi:serine/threonine protein kinase/formylglycine-generating enzyme required for sulfatase activity